MRRSFDLVKSNIVSYINSSNAKNKIVLITFGEKEVKTVLNGTETREAAVNAVNKLKCNENGTLFYEALSEAYKLSNSANSNYDREYVIAFSDGIDLQKGSTTFDEAIKMYDSRALPLFAACSFNTSKDASDKFGELARASGGSFSIIKNKTDFNNYIASVNDVSIIKLKAAANYADGKEKQLSLKIGSSQVDYNVPITRSISDTIAPEVEKIIYDAEKDVFVISFSEKVVGAVSNNSYKITNSKGKKFEVSEVFYVEKEDVYEIKTKTPVTKDTYTFEFSGIADDSKEANSLAVKETVVVKKSNNSASLPLWLIILIVAGGLILIGAVVLVILLSVRKSNAENNLSASNGSVNNFEYAGSNPNVVKHHIKTNDAVRIKLRIITGKTSEQNIETSIVSSLIIGRSDTCDIYIDDTKLSRQHFAIENDNGNFYVMDLQSRNGTMLNGIRINSRQRISSGDKIMAGLSDIIFTILG